MLDLVFGHVACWVLCVYMLCLVSLTLIILALDSLNVGSIVWIV